MIFFEERITKGADQSAQMRRLVCAFVVRKPPKTDFLASRPIMYIDIFQLFVYWVILHAFLWSAEIFQNQLLRNILQEYHQSIKHFVESDQDLNCLQRLS